jgi:ABC-type polysaccharide/polyol phosphate transport system ATPase subunit
MEPVIEVKHVAKSFRIPEERRATVREHALALFRPRRFRELKVLEDVSFTLRKGEALGIMGRNGSGKSTLLKIVSGIYQPDTGSIDCHAVITPILELGVGWNTELPAVDNIYLIGTVMGMSLRELRKVVPEILSFAGLEGFAALELKHFSTGMAARLAYAIAFFAVGEVLILDEILAVGDAAFRRTCFDRFQSLRQAGHSAVLVTHAAVDVRQLCDRGLLLEGGRVIREGSGSEIADAYLQLLGSTPGLDREGG